MTLCLPRISDAVVYVSIDGRHYAAIVTDPAFVIDREAPTPHVAQALAVFAPGRAPFYVVANEDQTGAAPLSWHWPERAPAPAGP